MVKRFLNSISLVVALFAAFKVTNSVKLGFNSAINFLKEHVSSIDTTQFTTIINNSQETAQSLSLLLIFCATALLYLAPSLPWRSSRSRKA